MDYFSQKLWKKNEINVVFLKIWIKFKVKEIYDITTAFWLWHQDVWEIRFIPHCRTLSHTTCYGREINLTTPLCPNHHPILTLFSYFNFVLWNHIDFMFLKKLRKIFHHKLIHKGYRNLTLPAEYFGQGPGKSLPWAKYSRLEWDFLILHRYQYLWWRFY